jgi:hypothetical protein
MVDEGPCAERAVRRERNRHVAQHGRGHAVPRGDVFLASSGGVQEYTPTGQLVQTVPGTSGASADCFDPSGAHLIVPGVGLFDNAGNRLASNWATVAAGKCVADGLGNVYVGTSSGLFQYVITKYDLAGNPIQMFPLTLRAVQPMGMDLAPDECTMFVGGFAPTAGNGQLNVCTGTQSGPPWDEDIRVLPNWQLLMADDGAALLSDQSRQLLASWQGSPSLSSIQSVRQVALDPDGSTFWSCCWSPRSPFTIGGVARFSLSGSTAPLSVWPADGTGLNIYGPPLLGNANLASRVDSTRAGSAEAFLKRVRFSGQLTRLHVWLDASTTAQQVVVGIYSNGFGRPATLMGQGTIANVRPGSWNYVDVPSMPVKARQFYWVAVLAPGAGGTAALRDKPFSGISILSAQDHLTALPQHWPGSLWKLSGELSAYGS